MKNTWTIGFIVILIGTLGAIWVAGKKSNIPSPTGKAKDQVEFNITAGDHIKGAPQGKVTLVEFSDFQCPACRSYYPVLNELVKMFPNDLRVVYKHFPLKTLHIGAIPAARSAEAAALQGKFWEMHNLMFDDQENWALSPKNELFERYANEIGLDLTKFRQDFASSAVKEKVDAAYGYSLSLGLNQTPTFYLNGKKIDNPANLNDFAALITSELAK